MAKQKFRPVVKRFPQKIIDSIKEYNGLKKQETIVELMVKRDKAVLLGNKFKKLVDSLDARIAALSE